MSELLGFGIQDEGQLWSFLKEDVNTIKYISNPTEKMMEYAVLRNPNLIKVIKNPTDNVMGLAVAQRPELIQYLPQTETMCMIAVNKEPLALRFVKEQTEKVCLLALLKSIGVQGEMVFQYIKVRTQKVCETAVKVNPSNIKEMRNQSEEFYNSMIKVNWEIIRYMESPSIEQCLLAYEQDKRALDYLKI